MLLGNISEKCQCMHAKQPKSLLKVELTDSDEDRWFLVGPSTRYVTIVRLLHLEWHWSHYCDHLSFSNLTDH